MNFIKNILGWQDSAAAVSPPSNQPQYNYENMSEVKQSLKLLKSKIRSKKLSQDNSIESPYINKNIHKNNNYQENLKLPNIRSNDGNYRSKSVNEKNTKFEVLTRNHVPAHTYQLPQKDVDSKTKNIRKKIINKPMNTSLQDPYQRYNKGNPTQRKVSSHPPAINNEQQTNNYNVRFRGRTLNNSVHQQDRIIPTLRKSLQRQKIQKKSSFDDSGDQTADKSFKYKYKFNEDLERQYMMQIQKNSAIKNGNRYSENQPITYKPVQVSTKIDYDTYNDHQPISKSFAYQKKKIEKNVIPKQIKKEKKQTYEVKQTYKMPTSNYVNELQQIPIAKLKKQNQFIENPKPYDPNSLVECRAGCGRKFNPDSIQKHEKICYKVFSKKRKQFDAQKHRIVSNEQAKLYQRSGIIQQRHPPKQQKMSKWKMQSLAFRAAMKQNRNQDLSKHQQMMLQNAQSSSQVKCPHCGRTFNQDSGKKHVKICAANALKRR